MNEGTTTNINPVSADTGARIEAATPAGKSQLQGTSRPLPEDALIIVPVRNVVLFPGVVFPLTIGRERSRAAAQEAARLQRPLGVLLQSKTDVELPGPDDMHWVGTTANVLRYITAPDGSHHVICQGVKRFRVLQFLDGYPFTAALVEFIEQPDQTDPDIEGRALKLKQRAVEILELLPQVPSLSWAGASSRPRYFQLRGIGELEQYQGAPNPSVGFLVDEIDFSGGTRGLHHIPPQSKVFMPASIERSVWEYFSGKAEQKGMGLSELLTEVLKRDIEINEALK